jgi:hypothetical protein
VGKENIIKKDMSHNMTTVSVEKITREIYNKCKSPDIARVTELGRLECCVR